MKNLNSVSLEFVALTSSVSEAAKVEPFHVDIDAVRVRFKNGEEVIVTQSFTQPDKFDLWLSARDPLKPNQILPSLDQNSAESWLSAVSYRVLKTSNVG